MDKGINLVNETLQQEAIEQDQLTEAEKEKVKIKIQKHPNSNDNNVSGSINECMRWVRRMKEVKLNDQQVKRVRHNYE